MALSPIWPRALALLTAVALAVAATPARAADSVLGDRAPELEGGVGWLNTDRPLHLKDLRGKFVVLDFWTLC